MLAATLLKITYALPEHGSLLLSAQSKRRNDVQWHTYIMISGKRKPRGILKFNAVLENERCFQITCHQI